MEISDEQFREQHKPLHVPASYHSAGTHIDKVVFALADIGDGTADDVVRHLEKLDPDTDVKPLIAETHAILTRLYEKGQIAAVSEQSGSLSYNLHKITRPNDGAVNPDLLAPGLD